MIFFKEMETNWHMQITSQKLPPMGGGISQKTRKNYKKKQKTIPERKKKPNVFAHQQKNSQCGIYSRHFCFLKHLLG